MSDETVIAAADVARLAGVGRAAVSNWRRRHPDFPEPVAGSGASPMFRLAEVETWLRSRGKLAGSDTADSLWRVLESIHGEGSLAESVADVAAWLTGAGSRPSLDIRVRDALAGLDDVPPPELVDDLTARLFERQQRQHLATPPALSALMVELAGVDGKTVFDPACGPGNVLRRAAEHSAKGLYGQEIDPALARLAQVRLGPDATIATGDALRADAFSDLRADVVICDPPFGYRDWGHEELGVDPRWEYGFPVKGEPELAWLQHCLAHVNTGGTVVMAMPAGVASRRSGRTIRQALLRRGVVRAVFALPPGVLMSTGIPIHLWVLRTGGDPVAEPVLLVDAGRHRPERRGLVDWSAVRRDVLTPWREFSQAGEVREVAGVRRTVAAIELLDEDVDLTPATHLPAVTPELDAAALDAERSELARALRGVVPLLPRIREASPDRSRTWTTVNDLARAGALELWQQVGRVELSDDATGPLVLTGRDVATGVPPSMRLMAGMTGDLEALRTGDVVVPSLVAGDGRPTAVVVDDTSDGVLLGPNLQLIRVDGQRLDPEFVAGHVRTGRSSRASSTTASGVHRLDARRVEIPMLDIEEQRAVGASFRRIHEVEVCLRDVADRGQSLVRQLAAGLADGVVNLNEMSSD